MSDKTGQCLCGAVKFTARDVSTLFGACYCDMCKRWAGGRWMGVQVKEDNVDISGAEAVTTCKTSQWAERAFCNKCGSSLWYRITDGPDTEFLSLGVGLLDSTDDLKLAWEFYVDRKTCAYDFPEERKQLTEADVIKMFTPSDEGEPK